MGEKQRLPVDSKEARDCVQAYVNAFMWLKVVRDYFIKLFHDDETLKKLVVVAVAFFNDLRNILHEYWLLKCLAMFDKAKHDKRENLSLEFLAAAIDWPAEVKAQLVMCLEKVQPFRDKIRNARNRIISHHDKETVLDDELLGAFGQGEDQRFVETLEVACGLMHEQVFRTVLGSVDPFCPGDVGDFKNALDEAVAFRRLLDDAIQKGSLTVSPAMLFSLVGLNG